MRTAGRHRLHIENLRSQAPAFHITPECYARVAARFPEDAAAIDVTFGWDGAGLLAHAGEADYLIGWRFPHDAMRASRTVRWIHVTGAGIEHLLPFDWLPAQAVVTNNSGVHADKAAEYVMLAILALNNNLPHFATAKSERLWSKRFSPVVAGKTAVIVGTGNMGRAAAASCRALRVRAIGVNTRGAPVDGFDETVAIEALDAVLPRADFVVVAVPLTDRTRGLFSRERLARLKPGCGIVNIGRGAVIDHAALADGLRSGAIGGAVLDVFPVEPLPETDDLWSVPNLLITPHVSSDDADEYAPATVDLFFRNFRRLVEGRDLINRVDPSRQY